MANGKATRTERELTEDVRRTEDPQARERAREEERRLQEHPPIPEATARHAEEVLERSRTEEMSDPTTIVLQERRTDPLEGVASEAPPVLREAWAEPSARVDRTLADATGADRNQRRCNLNCCCLIFGGITGTIGTIATVITLVVELTQKGENKTAAKYNLSKEQLAAVKKCAEDFHNTSNSNLFNRVGICTESYKISISGQILFMNYISNLAPLQEPLIWEETDKFQISQKLVDSYSKNNSFRAMYETAGNLTYQDKPLPKYGISVCCQLALGKIQMNTPE